MPHKHKRQKTSDFSSYNLPPTSLAKALPTKPIPKSKVSLRSQAQNSTKSSKRSDDTPRAFTRLLAFKDGQKPPSGLDDGSRRKKSNTGTFGPTATAVSAPPTTATTALQRLPHESMAAFSQRVNAALPISGLSRSRSRGDILPSIKGLRPDGTKQTRMEKKMQKMQREWREAKKRRDEAVQDEDGEEDDDDLLVDADLEKDLKVSTSSGNQTKRSRKRRRQIDTDDDGDPWAELNARKRASMPVSSSTDPGKGLVGLHDVVVAPPKLSAPRATLRDAARDVPKAAGSLRRREELAKSRTAVLSAIRKKKGHPPQPDS